MSSWLASGLAMPLGFNDSITVFIPKGTLSEDAQAVVRDPSSLRLIALKNSDHKIIAAAYSACFCRPVADGACSLQRGFIKGRRFLEHVVDLDAAARAFSLL